MKSCSETHFGARTAHIQIAEKVSIICLHSKQRSNSNVEIQKVSARCLLHRMHLDITRFGGHLTIQDIGTAGLDEAHTSYNMIAFGDSNWNLKTIF